MGWSSQDRQTKGVVQTKPSVLWMMGQPLSCVCGRRKCHRKVETGESQYRSLPLHGSARLRCPRKACATSLAERRGGGSCLPPWRLPWWRCCAPILTVCAVLLLLSVLKDIRWRVAPHWQCVSVSFTPTTAASPQNAEGSPLETGCRQLGDVHMRSNNRT